MGGRLVLVRHAKSDYPWGVEDHDRPLNERGRRDAPEVGSWLDEHVTWVPGGEPAVRVSTARRAQLTWSLAGTRLSDRWAAADVQDDERIYEAPVSQLCEVIVEAAASSDSVLLVGHNPGLAGVIHAYAEDDALRRQATAKFPTSAVAVLECEGTLADAITSGQVLRVTAFAVPRG